MTTGRLAIVMAALFCTPAPLLAAGRAYHLEYSPPQSVAVTLRTAGTLSGSLSQWMVVLAWPEPLPCQTVKSVEVWANGQKISSPGEIGTLGPDSQPIPGLRRPALRQAIAASGNGIVMLTTYMVTLRSCRLREGPPPTAVPPLSQAERERYTAETLTGCYSNPRFAGWVTRSGLVRRAGEDDLAFQWRVAEFISRTFHYYTDSQQGVRKVSELVDDPRTDCGGLSRLYVAVMRYNHIPARVTIGRLLIPEATGHTRAEAFAAGIGWVPVDLAASVGGGLGQNFGQCPADMLVTDTDSDEALDSGFFGLEFYSGMQGPFACAQGANISGNLRWEAPRFSVR